MRRIILTFLILSFVLSSFSYSQTTETANTSSASFNSSSDSIRLPDCNGSYIKKCFGTRVLGVGDSYIGEFENNGYPHVDFSVSAFCPLDQLLMLCGNDRMS